MYDVGMPHGNRLIVYPRDRPVPPRHRWLALLEWLRAETALGAPLALPTELIPVKPPHFPSSWPDTSRRCCRTQLRHETSCSYAAARRSVLLATRTSPSAPAPLGSSASECRLAATRVRQCHIRRRIDASRGTLPRAPHTVSRQHSINLGNLARGCLGAVASRDPSGLLRGPPGATRTPPGCLAELSAS